MAISDLSGTKWLINSSCTFPQTGFNCSINFTSNFNDYIKIYIPDYGEGWIYYYTTNDSIQVYDDFSSNKWSDEAYRTIEITGGEGVTDSKLISWLEENATQLSYVPEITSIKMPDGSIYNIKDSQAREAIANLPKPMVFKGSVGTNGTVTWGNLPYAAISEGFTYKVITAHNTSPVCKVGDTIISNGSSWIVIPSGDEPSGTVTSVGAQGASGSHVSVSGSPITSSGTLTISVDSGYSIPSTTDQSTWSGKQDALVSGTNIKTINSTSLLGSGNINIVGANIGYTVDGYDVTITFQNSSPSTEIDYWWEVYSNYTITNNTLYLLSANQLGTRQTGTIGSVPVTTTTGKIFILCCGNQADKITETCGTITPSTGITTTGYRCSGGSSGDCAQISSSSNIYLDGETYNIYGSPLRLDGGCLAYSFTVEADGTISISGADWDD